MTPGPLAWMTPGLSMAILGYPGMSGAARLGWWGSTAITNWYAFTRLAYGLLAGGVAQSWQPGQRMAAQGGGTTMDNHAWGWGWDTSIYVYMHTQIYMIITYDATR